MMPKEIYLLAKGRTALKKRTKTTKNGRSKNSLYFVDNPDMNELKLLSSFNTESQQEDQEVKLHQSLAMVEVDEYVEQKRTQGSLSNEGSEQGSKPKEAKDLSAKERVAQNESGQPVRHEQMVKEALQEKRASQLEKGIIYTDDLSSSSVTGDKIAPFTIDSTKIRHGAIGIV